MFRLCAIFVLLFFACEASLAGPIRDKIQERISERQAQQSQDEILDDGGARGQAPLPDGVRVERDIAYGSDKKQSFDVYIPARAKGAPVIFMVHGGAWRLGDKSSRSVIEHKVARWVPKGFIFISTNYRMLPGTDPVEQAKDVARAIAVAQARAEFWGGDSNEFILMGHSAGAHLVALLSTYRTLSSDIVKKPWLGTVVLDSAAYDVVQIMEKPHFRLYDQAFGSDKQYWKAASPFYALTKKQGQSWPSVLPAAMILPLRPVSLPRRRRHWGLRLLFWRRIFRMEKLMLSSGRTRPIPPRLSHLWPALISR
ncbi:MAG: alpha/beta hydrolase [Sedimentisphaerales bacterium]